MGSKVLKNLKNQNKMLDEATKLQKKEEKSAKKEYREARMEAGIFASKEDRAKVQMAKMNYEREKMESRQGKLLQEQGETMQKIVNQESRSMGVFHSDKKLSAQTKQSTNAHGQAVNQFVQQTSGSKKLAKTASASKSSKGTSLSDKAMEQVQNMIMGKTGQSKGERPLPNIVGMMTGKDSGLSL